MPRGRKPDLQQRRRVLALRAQGLSARKIGDRLGVSPWAVHKILLACGVHGHAPLTLHCHRCKAEVHTGHIGLQRLGPVYCLKCLAKLPAPTFGQRLRAFRVARGLTLEALARQLGVSYTTLAGYEAGRRDPNWPAVERLIDFFGPELVTLGRRPAGGKK